VEKEKTQDFSKTVMWKKQIAADKERQQRWTGKVSLVLGTVGSIAIVLMIIYFLLR